MLKKALFIIIGAILSGSLLLIGFGMSIEQVEKRAYNESLKIVGFITDYHLTHHKYPQNIEQKLQEQNIRTTVGFGLLHIDITIQFHYDYFEVHYYELPIGPFHGYNSKEKEWGYFE